MSKSKMAMLRLIVVIAILLFLAACNSNEPAATATKQSEKKEEINDAAKPPKKSKKKSHEKRSPKKRKLSPEIEKLMQENRKLYVTAKSGKDKNITYVRLTPENEYLDKVADKLVLMRDGTSGPGTGRFTGKGFVFCKGNCDETAAAKEKDGKRVRWTRKVKQCRQRILENDWCAKSKEDDSLMFTIKFLSWPIEQTDCAGDCAEHNNQTAYLRIKSK